MPGFSHYGANKDAQGIEPGNFFFEKSEMKRRTFLKMILGAGAALFVPLPKPIKPSFWYSTRLISPPGGSIIPIPIGLLEQYANNIGLVRLIDESDNQL